MTRIAVNSGLLLATSRNSSRNAVDDRVGQAIDDLVWQGLEAFVADLIDDAGWEIFDDFRGKVVDEIGECFHGGEASQGSGQVAMLGRWIGSGLGLLRPM